jgi:hypothetical protein
MDVTHGSFDGSGGEEIVARAVLWSLAVGGKAAGLIATKKVIARHGGGLLAGMVTGHFGALRGVNDFEGVRALTVLGRWLPPSEKVARPGAVAMGLPMVPGAESKAVPRRLARVQLRSGRWRKVGEYGSQNAGYMAAIRAMVHAETWQAAARGRSVRQAVVETLVGCGPTGRLLDVVASPEEWRAATSWLVALVLRCGLWATGRGRRAELERLAMEAAAGDPVTAALVVMGSGAGSGEVVHRMLRTPEVAKVVAEIDAAVEAGSPLVLLGVEFRLPEFQREKRAGGAVVWRALQNGEE